MKKEQDIKEKKGRAKQQKTIVKEKWYVNLDKDMPNFVVGNDHFLDINQALGPYGPNMEIIATLHSNKTNKYFKSKWDLESDVNNTKVAIAGPGTVKAVLESSTEEEKRTLESDQSILRRYFRNVLKLPDIGGDKHKVICTKLNATTKNREILQVEVETWRRLWFTIFWTDDAQKNLINDLADEVKSAYGKGLIDFVHVPAENKLNWDHNIFAIVSSEDPQEEFVRAMHGGTWPRLRRKPFHLQIVLVKSCAKLKEIEIKFRIGKIALVGPAYEIDMGSNVLTVKLPKEMKFLLDTNLIGQVAQARPNFKFFNSIKSIKYTPGNKPEVTIVPTEQNVKYKGSHEFTLDMTGTLENDMGTEDIDIEFKVEVADNSIAGENKGNKIVIDTYEFKNGFNPKPKAEITKVLIHEIGHALDLVPDSNASWTHPNQYTGHGGQGGHCKYNAVLDHQQIYRYGGQGKMCIMYHQVHDHAGPDFCENCLKYLKITKLRSASLDRPGQLGGWTFAT